MSQDSMIMHDPLSSSDSQPVHQQYLTFSVADELFAVEILRVEEIRGWDRVTRVPNTPDHLCGLMNLRGSIVPVVDLRRRLMMPIIDYSATTVVIVLKVVDGRQRTVGLVVDAVADACQIDSAQLQTTPELGRGIDSRFISGLAENDGAMLMLLDIDRLLSLEALG